MYLEHKTNRTMVPVEKNVIRAVYSVEDIRRLIQEDIHSTYGIDDPEVTFVIDSSYTEDEWGMNRYEHKFLDKAVAEWEVKL